MGLPEPQLKDPALIEENVPWRGCVCVLMSRSPALRVGERRSLLCGIFRRHFHVWLGRNRFFDCGSRSFMDRDMDRLASAQNDGFFKSRVLQRAQVIRATLNTILHTMTIAICHLSQFALFYDASNASPAPGQRLNNGCCCYSCVLFVSFCVYVS